MPGISVCSGVLIVEHDRIADGGDVSGHESRCGRGEGARRRRCVVVVVVGAVVVGSLVAAGGR